MIEGHTQTTPGGYRVRWIFSPEFWRVCHAVSAINALQALARVLDNRTLRGHRKRWRVVRGPTFSPRHVRDPWRRYLDALAVTGREP